VPVYKNKVYAKILRIPKEVKLSFKNNEYYAPAKTNKSNFSKKQANPIENDEKLESKFHSVGAKPNVVNSSLDNRDKSSTNIPKVNEQQANNLNINEIDIDKLQFVLKDTEPIQEGVTINPSEFNKIFSGGESQSKSQQNASLFDSGLFAASNTAPNQSNDSKPDIFEFPKTSTISKPDNIFTSDIFNTPSQQPSESKKINPLDSGFFSEYQNMFTATNVIPNDTPKGEPVNINTDIKSNKPIDLISANIDYDTMCDKLDKILKEWSYNINEKKNLRLLLASLHEVWTSDEFWQEVSMKRLIEDEKYMSVIY
jgi:hypothetical protein